jgi:hypothetical protein
MPRTIPRRRAVLAATLALSVFLATPAGVASASTRVKASVCDYRWRVGHRQVKRLIRCAAHRWRVPGGPRKALSVARCESGFDPGAYGNGNAGVFQQNLAYWPARARAFGFPGWSAFNGRASVIVSVRMAHRGGWGPWSCA